MARTALSVILALAAAASSAEAFFVFGGGSEEGDPTESGTAKPPGPRPAGPKWLSEPPNEATFSNSSGLRLDCVASGQPHPAVTWYQRDRPLRPDEEESNDLRLVMPNGTLVFPPFR